MILVCYLLGVNLGGCWVLIGCFGYRVCMLWLCGMFVGLVCGVVRFSVGYII